MKKVFCIAVLLWANYSYAQTKDETAIRNLLLHQTKAWNRGNIEEFMQTYWQSDSLMFVGKDGVTYGWKNTLEHYKKGYPDKEAMGKLYFDIIQVQHISKDYFFVIGKWMIKRSDNDLSGHYSLLIRKIKGEWKIIADHSS